MCIAISLPWKLKKLRDLVEVQVVECATFLSEDRRALIAFDVFVLNRSDKEINLLCTHVDTPDVAQLATGDYFDDAERKDARAVLVRQVYEGAWQVDPTRGTVGFVDPLVQRFNAEEGHGIVARVMSYESDARAARSGFPMRRIDASCLCSSDGSVPIDRPGARAAFYLKDQVVQRLCEEELPRRRPFSTFRLGPFPPVANLTAERQPLWTLFRLSIELRGDVYDRLIGPTRETPFEMMSSGREVRYLDSQLSRHRPEGTSPAAWQKMIMFFRENIASTEITPRPYQIILGQPSAGEHNRYVQVRPTSSRIIERYIANADARRRAMWFHSEGSDFSLVLKYGELASAADPSLFRDPLPSDTCVPIEKSSTSAFGDELEWSLDAQERPASTSSAADYSSGDASDLRRASKLK